MAWGRGVMAAGFCSSGGRLQDAGEDEVTALPGGRRGNGPGLGGRRFQFRAGGEKFVFLHHERAAAQVVGAAGRAGQVVPGHGGGELGAEAGELAPENRM